MLFSIFFGAKAYALTLESHCQKISVNVEKTELSSINPQNCMNSKILKRSDVIFGIPSVRPNEYVVLSRRVDDAFFCKMPFDYLGLYDAAKGIEKKVWNSKDAFTSLVQMTNGAGIIRINLEDPQAKKTNLCSAFPAFFKTRIVPKGVMSKSLTSMKNGGYLMLSSRFSALYFFGPDLKKIEFVFNVPGEVEIVDALVRKNGELIILSSYGDDLIEEKKELCIDRWDLITGTMSKTRCGLKDYDQQVLIDREKVTRAYIQNKTLYFEEFNESFESKIIPVAKGIGDFNLNSAFVHEN